MKLSEALLKVNESLTKYGRNIINKFEDDVSFWKQFGITEETDLFKLKEIVGKKDTQRKIVDAWKKYKGKPQLEYWDYDPWMLMPMISKMTSSNKTVFEDSKKNPKSDIGNVPIYTFFKELSVKDGKITYTLLQLYDDKKSLKPSVLYTELDKKKVLDMVKDSDRSGKVLDWLESKC